MNYGSKGILSLRVTLAEFGTFTDEDNAYPRWHNGGVDAWVVDSIIYKIDGFDPENPYSEQLFAMLQNAGYNDREGFEECLYFFFKEAYKEHSYPWQKLVLFRAYEPRERRLYMSWSKGVLAKIPTIYLEQDTEAVITSDDVLSFDEVLLGSKYVEISKKRQEKYFANHFEKDQHFFDVLSEIYKSIK